MAILTDSAIEHLRRDPALSQLIDQYPPFSPSAPGDFFTDLIETIIGQQLSNKVADVLLGRFYTLVPKPILPEQVVALNREAVRGCGISYAKIEAIQGAGQAALDGALRLDLISGMPDEEVVAHLIRLRGVGRWTAEMMLIFSLQRPDVFSVGDLGLRTAVSRLYGVDRTDLAAITTIAEQWSPHRSLASRYLWRSLENQ